MFRDQRRRLGRGGICARSWRLWSEKKEHSLLAWRRLVVEPDEQGLTPGAIRWPQKTAAAEGTTRGKRPGAPEEMRRLSLMTPRRYGSFSNSAPVSTMSFLGIASRSSACSFFRMFASLRTLYVARVRVWEVVSVPAIINSSVSPDSSSTVGMTCPLVASGLSAVSNMVGRSSRDVVGRAFNSSMRSRAT